MRTTLCSVCVLFLLLSLGCATRAADMFVPPCPTIPFDSIKEHHSIDVDCADTGDVDPATGKTAKEIANLKARAEQNKMKNNLCAAGDPIVLSFADFVELQDDVKASGITFGSDAAVPKDRSDLKNVMKKHGKPVGEGTIVQIVGFIDEAHYAGPESVTCHETGQDQVDIHVALGETPNADVCDSVTAEIIPHYRPTAWTQFADSKLGKGDAPVNIHRAVRVTGQLFFDASHHPGCHDKGQPSRSSCWEIHPIYQIEVCKSPSNAHCDGGVDADWQPVDKWKGNASPGDIEIED